MESTIASMNLAANGCGPTVWGGAFMVNPFDPTLAKPPHSMGNSSCKDLRKSSDGVTFNHASGPVPVARSAPGHTRPART
ncbi:hypothetical protein, partial [Streptomyces sp. NPDC044948]|uniref:hypothetical protein n=1 Tax=Streptomyces sp. NPDC044948 TaxID=3157092 RepID=UPI0033F57D69